MELRDGAFRVSICRHGHVTLEVLEGETVQFVSVMSRAEARDLAERLLAAGRERGGRLFSRYSKEVH